MELFSKERRQKRQRFYKNPLWQRIRKIKLKREPLCRLCWKNHKRQTPANTVDHIHGWTNWTEFLDLNNLQCLCKSCHKEKTEGEDRSKLIRAEKLKIRQACI